MAVDWDDPSESSKPEFDAVSDKREEAKQAIASLAERYRENALDIGGEAEQTQQHEQGQEKSMAPSLELTPPEIVYDRSTEQPMTQEDAMNRVADMAREAQTRQEEFNRQAEHERTSPYLRDAEQTQGDDDISF